MQNFTFKTLLGLLPLASIQYKVTIQPFYLSITQYKGIFNEFYQKTGKNGKMIVNVGMC